jgi:hypothetical protein
MTRAAHPVDSRFHSAEAPRRRVGEHGSHGRAGINPRHKHGPVSFRTACAGFLAQSPPCEGGSSFQFRASSFQNLIETRCE